MSDCSDLDDTPPDTVEIADELTENLLPKKSRKTYESRYQHFMDWKMTKNTASFSENVLLAYFQELSKNSKSPTLGTIYSMLKLTISINHQIDISKYSKLTTFLKRKAKGYQAKKSRTFLPGEINKFLNEAPDQIYLLTKIALIFGILGACQRQELHRLMFNDVQVFGSTILVKVSNTRTKLDRSFTITGKYYELCQEYIKLRPNPCSNPAFFLNYRFGKCTVQNVGINKFGILGKTIAKYLKLPNPDLYTGHCFRRTSATLLVNSGGDITALKRRGGCMPLGVAESCIDD